MEIYLETIFKCILIFLLIQNIFNTYKFKSTKNLYEKGKNNKEYKTQIINNNAVNNSLGNQIELTNNIINNSLDKIYINKDDNESLEYSDYYAYAISYQELKIFLEYINLCKKGILLYKENLVKSNNPKISVIISIFNREQFINSTLRSVQNQKMKDIEIIYVDDCSTDNSVKYIKEAQKIDPRIILLQNEKNMGTLYTKSKGVLNAKGKYIYTLDSDDMIAIDDFLTVLYEEAEEGNYDFVDCGYIQIDIKRKYISRVKFFEYHLWAKLIKRELYVNIINKIGDDILNRRIVQEDDTFIVYFLYRGTKHKYIYKFGIFYFIHHINQAWRTRFQNTTKFCSNYNIMVNALYDVGYNSTKDKFLSFKRLRDNIINGVCIKIKELREMNIKLLTKFKDSPYMDKNQFQLINDTLNKLEKAQLIDNNNKNEDNNEKENEKGIPNIVENHENLKNQTIDDHLISK
jgi:glycosyltransferase involved in cell wall biosynthesis